MINLKVPLCLFIASFMLISCNAKVKHSFESADQTWYGLLDYHYYNHFDGGQRGREARVSKGLVTGPTTTYRYMYKGEYLYVKWSTGITGKVYERRIDLTSRLPNDMEDLRFYFEFREDKLYVFVIWPYDEKYKQPKGIKLLSRYKYRKQLQIYPDKPL